MCVAGFLNRSGSSDSSPSKNDVAEAAEYFQKVDIRASRKLWAQNNNCKLITHKKLYFTAKFAAFKLVHTLKVDGD